MTFVNKNSVDEEIIRTSDQTKSIYVRTTSRPVFSPELCPQYYVEKEIFIDTPTVEISLSFSVIVEQQNYMYVYCDRVIKTKKCYAIMYDRKNGITKTYKEVYATKLAPELSFFTAITEDFQIKLGYSFHYGTDRISIKINDNVLWFDRYRNGSLDQLTEYKENQMMKKVDMSNNVTKHLGKNVTDIVIDYLINNIGWSII